MDTKGRNGILIDTRIGGIERREYANNIGNILPEVAELIDEQFTGDETDDFYEGLLQGTALAYSILKAYAPDIELGQAMIVAVAVFTANHLKNKENTNDGK